jgi:hypothetical protein
MATMRQRGKPSISSSTSRKRKSHPRAERRSNEKTRWQWGTVAEIEILGTPKILLIDIDSRFPVPRLVPILARLRIIGLKATWISYRTTRHGWHLEIGINSPLKEAETVAAQAVLGSDLRRETMNLRRAISLRVHKHSRFWRKRWNILFLKKL